MRKVSFASKDLIRIGHLTTREQPEMICVDVGAWQQQRLGELMEPWV